MKRPSSSSSLKLLTVYFFVLMTSVSIAQVETDYLAILLQEKKIGYAKHTREVQDGKVITTDSVSMTLGRGGQAVTITSDESHIETTDGKPLGFEMTMTTSGIEQKTVGTVADGKVTTKREVMGQLQEKSEIGRAHV